MNETLKDIYDELITVVDNLRKFSELFNAPFKNINVGIDFIHPDNPNIHFQSERHSDTENIVTRLYVNNKIMSVLSTDKEGNTTDITYEYLPKETTVKGE